MTLVRTPNLPILFNQSRLSFEFNDYLLPASPPNFSILDISSSKISAHQPRHPHFKHHPSYHLQHNKNYDGNQNMIILDHNNNVLKISKDQENHDPKIHFTKSKDRSKVFTTILKKDKSKQKIKKVWFADDLGKQLVHVKVFSDTTDLSHSKDLASNNNINPLRKKIMGSVLGKELYYNKHDNKKEGVMNPNKISIREEFKLLLPFLHSDLLFLSYEPKFVQPKSNYATFMDSVEKHYVGLEYAHLSNENSGKKLRLSGKIMVRNLSYEKNVFIRCTLNGWLAHIDVPANYLCGVESGKFDSFLFDIDTDTLAKLSTEKWRENHTQIKKFAFNESFDCNVKNNATKRINYNFLKNSYLNCFQEPESVEFAACFIVSPDLHFWDNNNGQNYKFIHPKQCHKSEFFCS